MSKAQIGTTNGGWVGGWVEEEEEEEEEEGRT